ncbi:hypothetical protein LTR09_003225 [Extremus antarcticus]|uniref:Uncharacterized protein n=1 Tax=Extremus antarcticus TaxID=702011 RepID=A0AAJ0GEI6_9PEZI|nr:hypothetical protein LTR09_003225 [Extremus antarcticus]
MARPARKTKEVARTIIPYDAKGLQVRQELLFATLDRTFEGLTQVVLIASSAIVLADNIVYTFQSD